MRKLIPNRYLVILLLIAVVATVFLLNACKQNKLPHPDRFGIGRPVSLEKIKTLDIDVMPDGRGLPDGSGDIKSGELIYNAKCIACHGNGEKTESPLLGERLFIIEATGNGQVAEEKNKIASNSQNERIPKTIGTYWPYATTIFDYVRRAMPYNAPGSLTDAEVYDLTAYLLYQNNIISDKELINAETLPKIVMPNRKNYVDDDRKGGTELK